MDRVASDDASAGRMDDQAALLKLFDDTRKRLVETGTRNRLVHVNRQNTRGTVINVVNERADSVFPMLTAGKAMRFLALGRDQDEPSDALSLAEPADPADSAVDPSRYADARLETRLGPSALQKRLLKIAREAQTAEEESGVNVLYLALGFLTWFEPKAPTVAREAPLLLLPVQLTRNQRSATYELRLRDEDVVSNLPLQQRLKDDFGIVIPDIEIDEAWTPSRYFEQLAAVVAGQTAWKLDGDGMQLGFFSFSKLLMYRDLAPDAWPDGAIGAHPLTRGLLFEGFAPEPPLIEAHDRLDEVLPLEQIFHVVDADASQAIVIEEVRRGRNLVVQGPPGTGKSQTITNIIAAAVQEGKRVLFVAEKMAALSVVHDRLVKVGLRDVCLELHSRTAKKKDVLAELARTMAAAGAAPDLPAGPAALTEARDALNLIAGQLHQPIGASGETPYSVLGTQARFIGQGVNAPSIDGGKVAALTAQQFEQVLEATARYGAILRSEGSPAAHPFAGVANLALQPVDIARLEVTLARALDEVTALGALLARASAQLGAEGATSVQLADLLGRLQGMPGDAATAARLLAEADLARFKRALASGQAWVALRAQAARTFTDAALDGAPPTLRGAIAAGVGAFFTRWGGAYRGASRELAGLLRERLPPTADERLRLVDALSEVHAAQAAWQREQAYGAQQLAAMWQGEASDFAGLLQVCAWCEQVRAGLVACGMVCTPSALVALASTPALLDELRRQLGLATAQASSTLAAMRAILGSDPSGLLDTALSVVSASRLAAWLAQLAGALARYAGWVTLRQAQDRLVDAGLVDVAARMEEGALSAADAAIELRYARAESLWNTARARSTELQQIGQLDRHALVADFARLERARLRDNVTTIVARHLAQVPQGAMGEMKIIRGEIGKKRGHIALRKLFSTAGTALQRIKPVMLMSPISVAQYIPPGALAFDLLVIDEASQVRPEDALGAIARARQIVVVGDQQQLPPSSFFDRLLSDEADDGAAEEEGDDDGRNALLGSAAKLGMMESVLSLCEARGLNSRMLRWHYRSRDPSLIQVSNHEFYDDQLILPPSPLEKDPAYGMTFTRVDGVYDRGGRRDNRREGEAIAARVAEHARATPDLSLGIVTFSSAQKTLITELLELARRSDPVLNDFLRESYGESVFVKNIENVQGDERDVILVSVGYGPALAGGKLTSMAFGPVNGEGGERRLNVLFTRARLRCEVFASFDPADIDPGRTTRDGVRILKRFLEFANGAGLGPAASGQRDTDSPFEQDVAQVIAGMGYLVDAQVGSSGFRIDLGIRHPQRPGTYLLAVECDGATYHSALWARERDRLRQEVLEHLGWRFYRIWSTDWFYRRPAEIERLRSALAAAHLAAQQPLVIAGANQHRPLPVPEAAARVELAPASTRQMPAYQRCQLDALAGEPHELPLARLSELVVRIVNEEGPIHFEEVARRVATCFGKEKAGTRIIASVTAALEAAAEGAERAGTALLTDGMFWFTEAQVAATPVRDRSLESGATQKAACISSLELRAALKLAREDNAAGDDAELMRAAARLLGFKRVGADLQERLADCLNPQP